MPDANSKQLLLFFFFSAGCQLCMGHAVDKDLLTLVQQNVKDLINDYNNINAVLALQSKQLANVKDALVQQQKERQEAEMTRREEIYRILKRLLSFKKFVKESLLMKFQALEGGLSKTDSKVENLEQGLAELKNKVEQLGQEDKGRRTMDVKAG